MTPGKAMNTSLTTYFIFQSLQSTSSSSTSWGVILETIPRAHGSNKLKYSTLTWDRGKYTRTINHPPCALPMISVNKGFSLYNALCLILSLSQKNEVNNNIPVMIFFMKSNNDEDSLMHLGNMVQYTKCGHVAKATIVDIRTNIGKFKT